MAYLSVVERAVVGGSSDQTTPGTSQFGGLAGLTGLGLSYALPIVGALEGLIGSFAQTEKEMVWWRAVGLRCRAGGTCVAQVWRF